MTTIVIPLRPRLVPAPEARAGAVSAVGDGIRLACRRVDDAIGPASSDGLPGDFEGDASEAAGAAMTQFVRDGEAVGAALLAGLLAVEAYADDLDELEGRRTRLNDRIVALGEDLQSLRSRVDGAPAEQVPSLTRERDALQRRCDACERDADAWQLRLVAAEERVEDALRRVDSLAEGRAAADAPGGPDPDALARELRGLDDDPAAAHRWWQSLDAAEQDALIALHPELVGGSDGIPVASRDEANRSSLAEDVGDLESIPEGERSEEQQRLLERAQEAQSALEQGGEEVDPTTGEPLERLLLLYQPGAAGGDGFAAIAFGDPDRADHTSVSVPGIMNDGSKIDGGAEEALALWREASAGEQSVSTVAWIGYDAPTPDELDDIGSVGWQRTAEQGGADLADLVLGMRASHTGEPTDLTVIGHSYGSTTVASALDSGMGAQVDAAVLLGSPGAGDGNDSAADLVGDDGELYVGSRDRDPVTWLGRDGGYDVGGALGGVRGLGPLLGDVPPVGLGADPAHQDFDGATRIDMGEGSADPRDWLDNHTTYYSGDGLSHLGDIVADRDLEEGAVVDGRDQHGGELARDAVRDAGAAGVDHVVEEGSRWAGERVSDAREVAEGAGEVLDSLGEVLRPRPLTFGGLL